MFSVSHLFIMDYIKTNRNDCVDSGLYRRDNRLHNALVTGTWKADGKGYKAIYDIFLRTFQRAFRFPKIQCSGFPVRWCEGHKDTKRQKKN